MILCGSYFSVGNLAYYQYSTSVSARLRGGIGCLNMRGTSHLQWCGDQGGLGVSDFACLVDCVILMPWERLIPVGFCLLKYAALWVLTAGVGNWVDTG